MEDMIKQVDENILTVSFVSVSPKSGFVREMKIAQKVGSGFN